MPTPIRPTRLPGQCNACFVPGHGVTVTLCPLHAAAERMLAFIEAGYIDDDEAAAILRAVKGGK